MGGTFVHLVATTVQKTLNNKNVNTIVTGFIALVGLYISFLAIFRQDILHPFHLSIPLPTSGSDLAFKIATLVSLGALSSAVANALNILLDVPVSFGATLVGVVLGNVSLFSKVFELERDWDSMTHRLALVILICRWGVGLQLDFILFNWKAIFWFGFFVPSLGIVVIASASVYVLQLSWQISLLLGAIIAASSTPVIMPVIVDLRKQGFGIENRIPQIIPASVSINTFVCLLVFVLSSTCAFSRDTLPVILAMFSIKLLSCVMLGILSGMLLWYFPKQQESHRQLLCLLVILSTAGITTMFALGCGFAGIVYVLLLGSVSCLRRRKIEVKTVLNIEKALLDIYNYVTAPLLFVLVGMKLKWEQISLSCFGVILGLIVLGFAIRVGFGLVVTSPTGYKVKNRLVILLSMVPKATLQGALAPSLIEAAAPFPEYSADVAFVVNTAIMVILLTGPLGKFLLSRSAPNLLERSPTQTTLVDSPLDTKVNGEAAPKGDYLDSVVFQRPRNAPCTDGGGGKTTS